MRAEHSRAKAMAMVGLGEASSLVPCAVAVRFGSSWSERVSVLVPFRNSSRVTRPAQVFVACPGRLNDFLSSGAVSLSNASCLVLEDSDRMLDMGYGVRVGSRMAMTGTA